MTFNEFLTFVGNDALEIGEVTHDIAERFADQTRKQDLAVDTHNRKIKRLRKVFTVLKDYREGENPFVAKSLLRKPREEQGHLIRRLSFSREQEEALLEVLSDTQHKVMNKPALRVVYCLGMFTGQRFKDCILLRWDKIDLNRRRIYGSSSLKPGRVQAQFRVITQPSPIWDNAPA